MEIVALAIMLTIAFMFLSVYLGVAMIFGLIGFGVLCLVFLTWWVIDKIKRIKWRK